MYSGTPTTIQHPCKRRIWRLTVATLPPAPADLLHQSVCGAVRRFLRHELNGCHSRRDGAAFGVGQAVLPLNRSYLPISSSAKTGRSSVRGTVMIGGLARSGVNGRMECGPSRIKGHRVWRLARIVAHAALRRVPVTLSPTLHSHPGAITLLIACALGRGLRRLRVQYVRMDMGMGALTCLRSCGGFSRVL